MMLRTIFKKTSFLVAAMAMTGLSVHAETGWLTDYEAALQKAQEKGRKVMVNFSGSDWCVWCIRLENEVLNKEEFKTFAEENLVLLELDFPRSKKQPKGVVERNRALAEKYGVRGFPTVLLLNSQGTEVGRTGYRQGGAKEYVKHLKDMIRNGKEKESDSG